MARRSQHKRHKSRGRGRRGGASPAPLQAASYGGSGADAPKWSASVSGGLAAVPYKSLISQVTGGATGAAASQAMNSYAMRGGGSRRKRHAKGTHRRHRGGAAPMGAGAPMMKPPMGGAPAAPMKASMGTGAPAAPARVQGGGMFASFGALLKEALVPLGLLAAQQTYGKRYSRKHRSSRSHTRKHRR
jgi:hypothetical protein